MRLILVVAFLHIALFLVMILTAALGFLQLEALSKNLLQGDIGGARRVASTVAPFLTLTQTINSFFALELKVLGKEELVSDFQTSVRAGREIASGVSYLTSAVNLLKDLARGEDVVINIKTNFKLAHSKFANSVLLLKSVHPPIWEDKILEKTTMIEKYQGLLTQVVLFGDVAPQLLGDAGKKTYLVLLQNNMELRPTGGFIGSYALVSLEKSKITSLGVYDVYSADGQLKGHVEPPAPIRKYLEQPNWFLRDSNWDPDFTVSAQKAAWFLEKEVGVKVDGVIGVDTSLIGLLIEALGNIYLPDYQETITRDNLAERANFWAHKDFFPGSKNKADFIASLSRVIFDKIQNDQNISWVKLLKSFSQGLEEKHLLLFSLDPSIQSLLTLSREKEEGLIDDFMMAVDANLGVNKVNYFVKRSIKYAVNIDENGEIATRVKIIYTNESPNENYKNYLRIFTPPDANFTQVEVDNQLASEVDWEVGGKKNSLGLLMVVPPKMQKTATATYQASAKINQRGSSQYKLRVLKQPGTISDSLTVEIKYPPTLKILKIDGPENSRQFSDSRTTTITTSLVKDREFKLEFVAGD